MWAGLFLWEFGEGKSFEGKVVKREKERDRQKERKEKNEKGKKINKRQDKSHGNLACIVCGISMAHFGTTPEYK